MNVIIMSHSMLNHYTPYESFVEIIKTGSLFLNDCASMKDEAELFWIRESLKNSKMLPENLKKEVFKELNNPKICFTASFARTSTNAHMWDIYAEGNTGVCITFSDQCQFAKEAKINLQPFTLPICFLAPVEYVLENASSPLVEAIIQDPACTENAYMIATQLSKLAPLVKKVEFDKEDEVRIVYAAGEEGGYSYGKKPIFLHAHPFLGNPFAKDGKHKIPFNFDAPLKNCTLDLYGNTKEVEEAALPILSITLGKNCSKMVDEVSELIRKHIPYDVKIAKSNYL